MDEKEKVKKINDLAGLYNSIYTNPTDTVLPTKYVELYQDLSKNGVTDDQIGSTYAHVANNMNTYLASWQDQRKKAAEAAEKKRKELEAQQEAEAAKNKAIAGSSAVEINNRAAPAPQPVVNAQSAVNAQPASFIDSARQNAEETYQDAKSNLTDLGSNISGTVNTSGADVVQHSGTRSTQNSTSNTTSYNTGTSVSQNQGRSESYSQEGMTPEQRAQFVAEWTKMHPGYMLNDKGEVVRDPNAALFDALQIDREKLRGERERQEGILRKKQLAHGLANSAMLISDMISAGIGGNVYKRDKDKTNEEADKEIARLREQQISDDMAAKEKEKLDRDKWSANLWKDLNDYRRSLYRNVNESNSTGSQQSVQQGQQFNRSQQIGKSNTVQTVSYDDALKGSGLHGYSRRAYGHGGGHGSTYWPLRITNGAHGTEYMSFAINPEEKKALKYAIASSLEDEFRKGLNADKKAVAIARKYYTPGTPAKLGKKAVPAEWKYDELINDGALYQIPGVLNRYLDELERIGLSHSVNGADKPYSRAELYEMITGDTPAVRLNEAGQQEIYYPNLPDGVDLEPQTRTVIEW